MTDLKRLFEDMPWDEPVEEIRPADARALLDNSSLRDAIKRMDRRLTTAYLDAPPEDVLECRTKALAFRELIEELRDIASRDDA